MVLNCKGWWWGWEGKLPLNPHLLLKIEEHVKLEESFSFEKCALLLNPDFPISSPEQGRVVW